MQITIDKGEIRGVAKAPPSKSYTIRGLMCAALARGESHITNALKSDDTSASLSVLHEIGVSHEIRDRLWVVRGGNFKAPSLDLFCRDSAATLRFMTAICSAVPGICCLTAGNSLAKRPVRPLVDALKGWGIDASCQGEFAPVTVAGGSLKGGITRIPGDISSQFVSALLMIAPLAEQKSFVRLATPLESRSYVLMTIECLQKFGIDIKYTDDLNEFAASPQIYQPAQYQVEGDWSSASYLLALGAVAGPMRVEGLNLQSLQGDRRIMGVLRETGARVDIDKEAITVSKGQLKAIRTDLNECIDLLPTIAVLAALAEGTSELVGIRRARLKESDRVLAVRQGLERAGTQVIEEPDRLIISGGKPQKALIDSHNDHRIAMAFSILGVAAGGITIDGAECVSKTYPEYWKVISRLGVKINER